MKLCQIREYSKNALRENKMKSFFIAIFLPSVSLFFRLAEICFASVILYITNIEPMRLFYQPNLFWSVFAVICGILKCIAFSAIIPAVIWYFSKRVNMNIRSRKRSFSSVLCDSEVFRKSVKSYFLMKFTSLVFLLPVVFFCVMSVRFVLTSYQSGNSEILFLTVHSVVLTVLSLILWIWALLGLSVFPFLIVKYRKAGVFRLLIASFKVMSCSRFGLVKIIVYYFLKLLIPFSFIWILPEFWASYSLYINICIKEAEYIAGDSLYSRRTGNPRNTTKIPRGKKGSIQASAD